MAALVKEAVTDVIDKERHGEMKTPDMETNPLKEEQRDLQEGSTLIPIWRGQLRLLSVVGR